MSAIRFIKGLLLLGLVCVNTVFAQMPINSINNLIDFGSRDTVLPDNIDSANCVFFPDGNEWGVKIGWSSAAIVSNLNIPLVGDLDDDGHPEIICFSKDGQTYPFPFKDNQVLVFDGVSKQLKATLDLPSYVTAYDAAAYGVIKTSSRKGLIIVACYDLKLRAYDITSANPNTPYWVSNVDYGTTNGDWAVNVSFADFNHDGHPEVYVRNKIYNAETGVLLATATGGYNTASSWDHFTHITHWKMSTPVAADVCDDEDLELILGNEVYMVNITNPNGTNGNSITLERQITPPNGVPTDGNPQIADFNADGHLDVFISIRNTENLSGTVYGYVWDVYNNMVSAPFIINTSCSGKSIPMIGDIDNDGLLEVLIQCGVAGSDQKFQAYKYHPNTRTFDFMWGITTDEDSYSNSITAFDFNQDGLLELIICDQSKLRIVNGSGISHITHNDTIPVYVMSSFPFSEITIMQYPVIVDADNDGNAEIVSVGSDKLNILESDGAYWAPTRMVWNQYMYNVTNINNDLTVTQYQFNNATAFVDPDGVIRYPFNNFLQQVTTLDQYGRPFYAVPDVATQSAEITANNGNASLNIIYNNQGDNTLKAPYSITVFANQIGGEVLQTLIVNDPLLVGETIQQNITMPISDLCSLQDIPNLVIAINCAGGGIAQNGGLQPECDITNNTAQVALNFQSEPTIITEIACEQYVWNGNTYSQSGQYQQILQDSYGCDSIVIMDLTITTSSETTFFSDTACDQYQWNGVSYLQSGQYQQLFQNIYGCDSIATLYLTIETASLYSIHGKNSIFPSTDITSGQYSYFIDSIGINPSNVHWDIDREDWLLVPHGASCDLVCMSEGQAVLHAWTEGELCDVDTTMVLNATFYSIGGNDMQSASVYPNPTSGKVTITWQDIVAIKVFNLLGQKVDEYKFEKQDKAELDMLNYQEGVYVLEITSDRGKSYKQLILTR